MSNHPLPVHMSCFGVSTEIVATVRQSQTLHSAPETWPQKFAAAKAQYDKGTRALQSRVETGAHASSSASEASLHYPKSTRNPARRSAVAVGQPMNRDAYVAVVEASLAKIPAPRAKEMSSSLTLDASKLQASGVLAMATDFKAIADSSTGGGGLPRPYGKFIAGRGGDGTAVWERLPPRSRTPLEAQRSPKGSPKHASPASGGSPERPDSSPPRAQSPPSQHASAWSDRHVISARARPPALDKVDVLASPSRFRRPEVCSTGPIAAGPAPGLNPNPNLAQLAPLNAPPGIAGQAGTGAASLQLPPATFLTEVPPMPGAALRVDCGHAAAKDFLKSALHAPPPHQAGPSVVAVAAASIAAATAAPLPPEAAEALALLPGAQPSGGGEGQQGPGHEQEGAAEGGGLALEHSFSYQAAAAGSSPGAGATQAQAQAAPGAASQPLGQRPQLGVSMSPAAATAAAMVAASQRARRAPLPVETSLPRRRVPALGR